MVSHYPALGDDQSWSYVHFKCAPIKALRKIREMVNEPLTFTYERIPLLLLYGLITSLLASSYSFPYKYLHIPRSILINFLRQAIFLSAKTF